MALVTQKVSDLSGQAGPEEAFAQVTLRGHPKVQEAKVLDVLVPELDGLKGVGDLIKVEVKLPDGSERELHIKHSDLAKWVPDDTVVKARQTRGRVPGSRLS